jgi:lipopolysaccharide export system protein LptC
MTNIATVSGRPQRTKARDAEPNPLDAAGPRRDAFRAAGRHTARVRLLRRIVLAGAVLGSVAVIAFAFFNPFRIEIPGVSIDGVGLNGSKVTMQRPKLTGFRSDGRPYDLVASSAVQDAKTPSQLELHDIDAHVTMADQSVIHIVSEVGLYDSSKETMQLKSAIHLTSDKGLDAHMQSAFVEFKSGLVDTREPLTVVNGTGTVTADSMHVTDNGAHIVFEGHVHSTVLPAAAAASTTASLKGTGQ